MKYISVQVAFSNIPASKNNFQQALQRIGVLDPNNVKRTTLKRKILKKEKLSDSDYIKRGILNVRKELNSNIGKNGKYKNRMFKAIACVKVNEKENAFNCWVHIPHAEYMDIVETTYKMLKKIDSEYCTYLFELETNDGYRPKDTTNKDFLDTVSPVQTNIILLSDSKIFNTRQHKILREIIRG